MQIDSQVTQIFLLLIEKEPVLSKPSILAFLQSLQAHISPPKKGIIRGSWDNDEELVSRSLSTTVWRGVLLYLQDHIPGEGWAFQEFSQLQQQWWPQHEICIPKLLHSKCELLCTNDSTAAWAQISAEFFLPVVKTGHSSLFGHFICLFNTSYHVNLRCLRSLWDK